MRQVGQARQAKRGGASCEQQAGAQAAAPTKFKSKIQFFAQAEKSNHCRAWKKVKIKYDKNVEYI